MGVAASTWVVVKDLGRKRICQIKPGDLVMTHLRQFAPVIEVIDEGVRPVSLINTVEGRRLVISEDQKFQASDEETATVRSDWRWKALGDLDTYDCFYEPAVRLLRSPGQIDILDDETRKKLVVMGAVMSLAEALPDGGWYFHTAVPERVMEYMQDLKLPFERPRFSGLVLHDAPYVNDTPVEGSRLPRVLFTISNRHMHRVVKYILASHSYWWPWKAGHYFRTSSYIEASHLQHVLLRAGINTGIDAGQAGTQIAPGLFEGGRWLLGEGPVWRVQVRNPDEAPMSQKVTHVEGNAGIDYIHDRHALSPARCYSLVMKQNGRSGFTANDIPVLDAAGMQASEPEIEEQDNAQATAA